MRTILFHKPRLGAMAGFALLVAVCAAAWLSSAVQGLAREPYRIGYAPSARIHVEARDRLKAVYGRAGLAVEFLPLPQKRSLVQAVDGLIDGDVGRIPGLEKKFPTLVRVDVKLMDLVGSAYVLKGQHLGDFRLELLETLRAGAVRGVLWAENIMGERPLEHVNNYETLFGMLQEGRIDVALANRLSAEYIFAGDRARYAAIRRLDPPVFHVPFYHYVNTKDADIVPKLEKALRELRAEDYWYDGEGN